MQDIKYILFDLDGVLVDACDWHYLALNKALQDINYSPISREDHENVYNGLPTKIKLEMLGITGSKASKVWELKQSYTNKIIQESTKPLLEKIELHEYLKKNEIKIACVTNSIRQTAELMLKSTMQYDYIDLIVSNEDVLLNKPNPDCYNYAINFFNANPKNCLCVEDSPTGIEAATKSLAGFLWKVKNSTEVNLKNYRRFLNENFNTNGR
jgi:HAD superfamily hydrolase (TIGR01509 family)